MFRDNAAWQEEVRKDAAQHWPVPQGTRNMGQVTSGTSWPFSPDTYTYTSVCTLFSSWRCNLLEPFDSLCCAGLYCCNLKYYIYIFFFLHEAKAKFLPEILPQLLNSLTTKKFNFRKGKSERKFPRWESKWEGEEEKAIFWQNQSAKGFCDQRHRNTLCSGVWIGWGPENLGSGFQVGLGSS